MQHPDEGTIHAWLDGALPETEAHAIEAHVAACEPCASRVAEARGLIAGSSRILSALDSVPGGVVPAGDAGVGVPGRAHERGRLLVYARLAAALAFVTAGGIALSRAGNEGLRTGSVASSDHAMSDSGAEQVVAAAPASAPAPAPEAALKKPSAPASTDARRTPARAESRSVKSVPVPATRQAPSIDAANSRQLAAMADESTHDSSVQAFAKTRVPSSMRAAPAAPVATKANETVMRSVTVLDAADTSYGFALLKGSVHAGSTPGVERRRYQLRSGAVVTLEITQVRGAAAADSLFSVGSENVLRWTERGKQYVLSGNATREELRRMKNSGRIR